MLYQRRIGRTCLGVREGTRSTLMGGRARKNTGYDTVYVVVAMANVGRDETVLGTFPSLRVATQYVNEYRMSFGLVTKG